MRALALIVLVGCGGDPVPATEDGPNGPSDTAIPGDGPPGGLVPGSLSVTWMHGSQNCGQNADPELQTHSYNPTTIIFRQNKCDTFEAPFIYLLLGTDRALLIDTGATMTTTLRTAVQGLIGSRSLVVAHSHGHGDHQAGDSTFVGQPDTMVIGTTVGAQMTAWDITSWPTDPGAIDLGDRAIDVLGIPGHQTAHVAFYDRQTGLLLTGDSLYPGFLFIASWSEYRTSMIRLAEFAATRPIAHVLGAHVEMMSTAGQAYSYGTTFQPAEHVLQLTAAHLAELAATVSANPNPPANDIVLDDFILSP
jgi:hydroxyacylglutathione hydrolase